MRLRPLAIAATVAAALLTAPAAYADHGEPVQDPMVDRYLQVAAQHWGGERPGCTTRDGQRIDAHAVMFDIPEPQAAAMAELGGCRIWLDTGFYTRPVPSSIEHCVVMVHEWGHLLGREHTVDPTDVMWSGPLTAKLPACDQFRDTSADVQDVDVQTPVSTPRKKAKRKRASRRVACGTVKRRARRPARRAKRCLRKRTTHRHTSRKAPKASSSSAGPRIY